MNFYEFSLNCKLSPKLGHKSTSLPQFQDARGGQKNTNNPSNNDHDEGCKSYQKFQGTRKFDCPAVIQLRGIKVFINPLYEVRQLPHQTSNSLKMAKKRALHRLKDDLKQGNIAYVMRYYIKIPLSTEHKGHPLGASATINHCVDRRIISKIYDLVQRGVTRPEEVRGCLEEFVERELFANVSPQERPKKCSRKYYPTRQDLRNHITKAIAASKYCKDDQESLRQKVSEWQASGTGNSCTGQKGKTVIMVKILRGKSFFLSIKEFGSKGFLRDTDQSWFSLTPPTRPLSTHCHYFSSVSTPTSAIKLWPSSFAKTKMQSPLLKHFTSLKVGMSGRTLFILWLTTQLQRSTPLKRNFQLP